MERRGLSGEHDADTLEAPWGIDERSLLSHYLTVLAWAPPLFRKQKGAHQQQVGADEGGATCCSFPASEDDLGSAQGSCVSTLLEV